jgi:hypothetical protein
MKRPLRILAVPLSLASFAVAAIAQTPATPAPQQAAAPVLPAACPADVSSPDAIIGALYDVISGPAGQKRDWDRFRSLFIAGARLIPAGAARGGGPSPRVLSPDDYAAASGPNLERNGFYEKEVARKSERYGAVLHAFSTYESRRTAQDPAPFARGINSIQLYWDGARWWVVTVYWQAERPDLPLPQEFLPAAK